jgi:hypothetical protein
MNETDAARRERVQCAVGSDRERAYYYQLDLGRSDMEIISLFTQGADWNNFDHFFLGEFNVALTDTSEDGLRTCMLSPDHWRSSIDLATDYDSKGN